VRCAAARKDLDNNHAAAAARAWRTMIGRGAFGGRHHERYPLAAFLPQSGCSTCWTAAAKAARTGLESTAAEH
jgi:hypothetical protein